MSTLGVHRFGFENIRNGTLLEWSPTCKGQNTVLLSSLKKLKRLPWPEETIAEISNMLRHCYHRGSCSVSDGDHWSPSGGDKEGRTRKLQAFIIAFIIQDIAESWQEMRRDRDGEGGVGWVGANMQQRIPPAGLKPAMLWLHGWRLGPLNHQDVPEIKFNWLERASWRTEDTHYALFVTD